MIVTDEQVAALRVCLAGDPDAGERLHNHLVHSGSIDGYGELIYAAFVTAIRRRFTTWTRADIIRFVARIRANAPEIQETLEPRAAENLIRRALNDNAIDNVGQETKMRVQVILLLELIEGERLDGVELDEFLSDVRALAERWWTSAS